MTTALDLALPAAAALWGAAAGSLLPRAAYRFSAPAGEDWRKTCPAGHPIRGWLGPTHCRDCPTDSPAQAPAPTPDDEPVAADGENAPQGPPAPDNETRTGDAGGSTKSATTHAPAPAPAPLALATALVCAALALATGTRPELAVWLLLAPVGVLLAVVDFRVQRLPDPLTLPFAAAALALLGVTALLPEHAGDWLTSLYAALALGGAYFVLFLINPGGMGFGDVKLALGAGAALGWYGWPTVLLGTFAGFLFGALYGGALVVVRRAGRKTAIAFGPFLIAGAFAGLLVGAYSGV
ncbi:A24 family peptidase [Streptomyces sp. GbtcB6]|uniref:prepilin peptidase n=1 Tax=Streptomyces sp. GbtcB6 TaxID=2824751 RepID=UPI001C2F11CA|nr:A24 family peptidase [Streptomyces sp. GbtcB6]